MKKIIVLFFVYAVVSVCCISAMEEDLTELALQQKAFDNFLNIDHVNRYDKEKLLAYINRADTNFLNTRRCCSNFDNTWTCLHAACVWNDIDVLTLLLNRPGIDKNPVENGADSNRDTPLIDACLNNCLSSVELLLQHNVDINYENVKGCTALTTACQRRGGRKIAELLLARDDLDMEKEHGNSNALLLAAWYEKTAVIDLLLNCPKVHKDKKNDYNVGFFYIFIQGNYNPKELHFFSEFDEDQKKTFLTEQLCESVYAAESRSDSLYSDSLYTQISKFVTKCLTLGADLNIRNVHGKRPVDVAEHEYNYLKGHVSYDFLAWKRHILHTFLYHTPCIADWELYYGLKTISDTTINCDVIRTIFKYYYLLSIERDIAFSMPIDEPRGYRLKATNMSFMRKLREQLLEKKLKGF